MLYNHFQSVVLLLVLVFRSHKYLVLSQGQGLESLCEPTYYGSTTCSLCNTTSFCTYGGCKECHSCGNSTYANRTGAYIWYVTIFFIERSCLFLQYFLALVNNIHSLKWLCQYIKSDYQMSTRKWIRRVCPRMLQLFKWILQRWIPPFLQRMPTQRGFSKQ